MAAHAMPSRKHYGDVLHLRADLRRVLRAAGRHRRFVPPRTIMGGVALGFLDG